jgi:hypothetical protein
VCLSIAPALGSTYDAPSAARVAQMRPCSSCFGSSVVLVLRLSRLAVARL